MKLRRHHNNKGARQIKRGQTARQLRRICRKLGLPYRDSREVAPPQTQKAPRRGPSQASRRGA